MGVWLLSSLPTRNLWHLLNVHEGVYLLFTGLATFEGNLRHVNLFLHSDLIPPTQLIAAFSGQTHQHQGVNYGSECLISRGVCVMKSR